MALKTPKTPMLIVHAPQSEHGLGSGSRAQSSNNLKPLNPTPETANPYGFRVQGLDYPTPSNTSLKTSQDSSHDLR